MISAGVPAGTAAKSPQNRAPLWKHAQGNYCAYLQELQVIGKASLEYPLNHLEICFQRSRRLDGLQDRNHITSSRADILQSANELFYGGALVQFNSSGRLLFTSYVGLSDSGGLPMGH